MQSIDIQDAYVKVFNRQREIPSLKKEYGGIAAYIGDSLPISSKHYFSANKFIKHIPLDTTFGLTNGCYFNCVYCPHNISHNIKLEDTLNRRGIITDDLESYLVSTALAEYDPKYTPSILFGGATDPTLYTSTLIDVIRLYKTKVEPVIQDKIWFHSYTTGLFLSESKLKELKESGLNELIFHLGASNFSEEAYKNLELARKYIEVITIETPSWHEHRDQLFDMLPRLEEIGIDHLNITSIDINNNNKNAIEKSIPHGQFYKAYNVVLDDDGLVYDIMKEVVLKGYKFSVFDLNNFVVMHSQGEAKYTIL